MIQIVRRMCVICCLAATAGIFETGDSSAQDRNPDEGIEQFAILQNSRVKIVKFDDMHYMRCPRLTGLFYATGEKLEILVPDIALAGLLAPQHSRVDGAREESVGGFVFFNDDCRYTITITKFVIRGDVEEQVLLRGGNRRRFERQEQQSRQQEQKARRNPREGRSSKDAIRFEGNKIVMDNDPQRNGFMQFATVFDPPHSKSEFSGLLFISPRAMTMYLVNVPKELSIESRKNYSAKSRDIDIRTTDSRISLSIRKEVYMNGAWTTIFGN